MHPMLKTFDGFTCHLAGTFVESTDAVSQMEVYDPPREGKIRMSNPYPKHARASD